MGGGEYCGGWVVDSAEIEDGSAIAGQFQPAPVNSNADIRYFVLPIEKTILIEIGRNVVSRQDAGGSIAIITTGLGFFNNYLKFGVAVVNVAIQD